MCHCGMLNFMNIPDRHLPSEDNWAQQEGEHARVRDRVSALIVRCFLPKRGVCSMTLTMPALL